jgi:Xaa-Pro aminopeptidase
MDILNDRIRRVQDSMEESGIEALLVMDSANIRYLSGFSTACFTILLPSEGEPLAIGLWLDIEEARKNSSIQDLLGFGYPHPTMTGFEALMAKISQVVKNHGYSKAKVGLDSWERYMMIKNILPEAQLTNAARILHTLRTIKSTEEIQHLRKAAEIADSGMEAAVEAIEIGVTELEIAAEAEYRMIKKGSEGPASKTIVASGNRTLMAHGFATKKRIEKDDLVMIDLGAIYEGYCSDLCRTFVVGKSNENQEGLFAAVKEAQSAALEVLKDQVNGKLVDRAARDVLAARGYEKFFPSLCGHTIGLRTEDGLFIREQLDVELKKDMVIALFQSQVGVPKTGGIRLEDMALITENGSEILTKYPRVFLKL